MNLEDELPLGFSMALAKNMDALMIFSKLSDDEKKAVINGTHNIKSKSEMNRYVEKLTQGTGSFY